MPGHFTGTEVAKVYFVIGVFLQLELLVQNPSAKIKLCAE